MLRFIAIAWSLIFSVICLVPVARAADPSAQGLWQIVEGGKALGWVLVLDHDGTFEAVIAKTFSAPNQVCSKCTDDRKNAPILGLSFIQGMKQEGLKYEKGNILDPSDGQTYPGRLILRQDGQQLNLVVSGFAGLVNKGQTWNRLPDAAIAQVDPAIIAKYLPAQAAAVKPPKPWPTPTPSPTASIPDDLKALQPVFYATNRAIKGDSPIVLASVTDDRSMSMQYGLTIVGVPKNHTIGNVERPKLLLLQSAMHLSLVYEQESDKDHFRIRSLTSFGREEFVQKLRDNSNSILLFIHGYNVPFQDAIFKAAQIAYDANFSGTVLVFSWPSAGAIFGYDYDRESATFSGEDLLKVLRILSGEIGKKRVFVLAHSLGNEILVNALQQAAISKTSLRIAELMFAAPDVDKDVFVKKANDIKSVAKNMTLYASSADKALLASEEKAWGTRMGYVGAGGPNLVDGIETLDVTAVGDDMLGLDHSTYSTRAVLEDIGHLIMFKEGQRLKPQERLTTLKFVPDAAHVKYWLFPK